MPRAALSFTAFKTPHLPFASEESHTGDATEQGKPDESCCREQLRNGRLSHSDDLDGSDVNPHVEQICDQHLETHGEGINTLIADKQGAKSRTVGNFPVAPDKSDNAEIWRTYVRTADEHDAALIRRWNEGIDVFLLFTGLFSAILSAFLIASWSTLQPDSGQATVDGLVVLSQQLVALSSGEAITLASAYQPQPFVMPWWAVAVNTLWFMSLTTSLVAAVVAMLVKEWLSAYTDNISLIPVERVRQRQFRYDGLIKWHVPSIVSFLPLSIHVAVFLFFTGLVVFAWPVSLVLSITTGVLLLSSFILYLLAAAVPAIFKDCPYKSPLSTVARWLWKRACVHSRRSSSQVGWKGKTDPRRKTATDKATLLEPCKSCEFERGSCSCRALEVKALAWLVKSPDPTAQESALHFLSWWRAPAGSWDSIQSDVQRAAASYVVEFSRAPKTSEIDAEQLEKVLVISSLMPDGRVEGFEVEWTSGLLKFQPSPSLYTRTLAESIYANLYSTYQRQLQPWWSAEYHSTELSLCSILEALHGRMHSRVMGRRLGRLVPLHELESVLHNVGVAYLQRQAMVSRTLVYKYVCLLAHFLEVESPECFGRSNHWMSRYPQDEPTMDRILIVCLRRLNEEIRRPDFSDTAYLLFEMRRALLLCITHDTELLSVTEALKVYGLIVELVGPSLTSGEKEGDYDFLQHEKDAVLVPLVVAMFRKIDARDIAYHCLPEVVSCLRYLIGSGPDAHILRNAFELPPGELRWDPRRAAYNNVVTATEDPLEQFITQGGMKELLGLIGPSTAPICLLAIGLTEEAIGPTWAYRGMARSILRRQMVSSGWLECMNQYCIEYLVDLRTRNKNLAGIWCKHFEGCVEWLLQVGCEEVETSGLLERYQETHGVDMRANVAEFRRRIRPRQKTAHDLVGEEDENGGEEAVGSRGKEGWDAAGALEKGERDNLHLLSHDL